MIKLVAFDWNGTLLADTEMNNRLSNILFIKYGKGPISLLKFRQTFTIPISIFWEVNGGKPQYLKQQAVEFHNMYLDQVKKTRSRAGSKQVLKWLKENNIESILYSNHTVEDIINQLSRLKMDKYINKILARNLKRDGHKQVHNRHKEEYLKDYIKYSGLKPKEVLTIGDTDEEIEIGKNLGIYTAAISGGYSTASRLKKHKPDFLIHNMKELIGIIKKLNK